MEIAGIKENNKQQQLVKGDQAQLKSHVDWRTQTESSGKEYYDFILTICYYGLCVGKIHLMSAQMQTAAGTGD